MAYLTKVLAALHLAVTVATAEAIKVVPFNQWNHQRIVTQDVQLHVQWAGSGPPLVLIHGFPQHSVCNPLICRAFLPSNLD